VREAEAKLNVFSAKEEVAVKRTADYCQASLEGKPWQHFSSLQP
jgi:hypothetical protein